MRRAALRPSHAAVALIAGATLGLACDRRDEPPPPPPRAIGALVLSPPLEAETEAAVAASAPVVGELARRWVHDVGVSEAEVAALRPLLAARARPGAPVIELAVPVLARAADGPVSEDDRARAVARCNRWLEIYVEVRRGVEQDAQRVTERALSDALDALPADAPADQRAEYQRRLAAVQASAVGAPTPVRILERCAIAPPAPRRQR